MGIARKAKAEPNSLFPVAGGQTGAEMRAHLWTSTDLGLPSTWPAALRIAVSLILNSPESMFLAWGPNLTFFFNDAYRPILGERLACALGAFLPELWADVWDQVRPFVEAALAGRPSRFDNLPLSLVREGKQQRTWWSFSYSPLYDADGAVAGMFCVTNETTKYVVGQMALRESEQRYRAIFESAIDYAIIVTDLNGLVTDLNEGAKRILGWTADDVIGRSIDMFFVPEERENGVAVNEMMSALSEGRGIDERWHLRKDGSRFWANGEMLTLRNDAEEVIGFVKILRDQTEQRNATARLQKSEANLRTIVETIPIGILLAEAPTGRIVGRNRRMDDIVGSSSAKSKLIENYGSWLAFHADGRRVKAEEFPLARVIQSGENEAKLEIHYQRRDGRRVWLDIAGAAVRDAEGVLTGAVVAVSDVDARKKAEAMQGLMNHELSHRMKNLMTMVLAITNQTMRHSTDIAAAREVLSDRLIAMSKAHDLLLGASQASAQVEAIVREGIAVHEEDGGGRLTYEGPAIEIDAGPALALAMMMHELCTNAAKYGALSTEDGRVRITWAIVPGDNGLDLRICWRESGGPTVAPPVKKGFGSRLIDRGLTGHVGGSVETTYAPDGLVCVVQASLARFKQETSNPPVLPH